MQLFVTKHLETHEESSVCALTGGQWEICTSNIRDISTFTDVQSYTKQKPAKHLLIIRSFVQREESYFLLILCSPACSRQNTRYLILYTSSNVMLLKSHSLWAYSLLQIICSRMQFGKEEPSPQMILIQCLSKKQTNKKSC